MRISTPWCLLLVLGAVACGGAKKNIVRFTAATQAQLDAGQSGTETWFEFQPGDEVPLNIGIVGAAETLAQGLSLVAKQRFFIVVFPHGPPRLSFDGEHIAFQGSESFLAFSRESDTNMIGVLTYLGLPENMPVELRKK